MTKYKILEILRNSEDYISGEKISEILFISRTAVWKGIKSLREKGYKIEGKNNKGYMLVEDENDIISEYEIKKMISQKDLGKRIYCFETINSTNTYALRNLDSLQHGDIIIADEQTAGRGKSKKIFYSPKEAGVYMSIVLKDDIFYDSLRLLSISFLIAVCKVIEKNLNIFPNLSWNEILISDYKLGGILTESVFESETGFISSTVIGIGINVNNTVFPSKLDSKSTSLKIESKKEINRKKLIGNIINECEKYIINKKYIYDRNEILEEYFKRMNLKDKEVEIKIKDRNVTGKVMGLDNKCGLIILRKNGIKTVVYNGKIKILNNNLN